MATALDLLMSTKEDVNLLSEESDICTIDAKTRSIFVPSTIVVGGVQSDKNAERIKFSCPKIVGDNLDLSKFSVRINFENVSSVDFNVSIKDQYICDDVAVDGENVTFSWLIGRNAARYMGTVRFIVCAVKTDSDSNISVEWNTTIAEVPVLEGIEIDQPQIGQEEKDVINQLLELTKNTSVEAVQNVNSAKEQAIKDIQSVSQPDTTLTIEGGLAEAKATGEAIGSLKEALFKQVKIVNSESPIEEIISLNIINRDTQFIDGYYYDINGNLVAHDGYCASDFVKIKPNTQYYSNTGTNVIIYDIGLNKIASYGSSETPFTTPNDAKYIKYAFLKDQIKNVRICEVNKNLPFINAYELNSVGKKLLQRSLYNLSHSVDYDVISLNGYLSKEGVNVFDNSLYGKYTTPIPCNEGDKFNYRGLGEYSVASCLYLNESLEVIGYSQYKASTKSVIVTVPSNAKYIQFSSYSASNNVVLEFSAIGGENSNILCGKKYVSCGDSFTEGDFTSLSTTEIEHCKDEVRGIYKTYPCLIANRNKMEYIQKAVCGGTIKTFYESILTTIPIDADYITIAYGLNDFSYNMSIGSIDDDVSADTFYGYWNACMNWLITNCTKAHIGIIVMPAYMGNAYRIAEENIAKKYGVALINLYTDKNAPMFMNKENANSTIQTTLYNRYRVSTQNAHPNLDAHERISSCIENWLRSI